MEWITILFILSIVAILGYQGFNKISNAKIMDGLLVNYYKDKGLSILKISKLSISEKVKYGVPLSPFIGYFTTTLGAITNSNNGFYRKIETVDKSDNEQIRYVESDINNADISVNEMDVYEF